MYSTLLCQSLIQCFAVEQQPLKVSLFSFFFLKKKPNNKPTKTKPVFHVLQYHECE